MSGVGYEVEEEKWTEWSYEEVKNAREKAAKFLGIEIDSTTPNWILCEKLGWPADMFRPIRLIRWAKPTNLVQTEV